MRVQVPSLVLLSRLRIRQCQELWCRSQMKLGSGVAVAVVYVGQQLQLRFDPSLGTSISHRFGSKKTKQNKTTTQRSVTYKKLTSNIET